jgi:murein DD-endopeptidase MepM/ murein hydrolase activator NlpD
MFIIPTRGRISPNFGQNRGDHTHLGIDIAANTGTPVVAAAAGRVTAANYSNTAGNLVYIDHGSGALTKYFHLQRSIVPVGTQVGQGQTIGYVGSTGNSTGPHLHWELHINGTPVDPLKAMQGGGGVPAQPSGWGDVPALPAGAFGLAPSDVPKIVIGLFAVLVVVRLVRG